MGFIYKIVSPTNKTYVGETYDLRKRINCHKCASKKGTSIILYNSIKKYGWGTHKLEIIEEVADELLDEREIFWIKELRTYCYENKNGMNMTKGGGGQRSTWMHKTEQRKKQSERFSTTGNPFYNRKHSKETKKLLSDKAKKRTKKSGGLYVPQPVSVYNKNGDLLFEFQSLSECSKLLQVSTATLKSALSGKRLMFGRYVLKYKVEAAQLYKCAI